MPADAALDPSPESGAPVDDISVVIDPDDENFVIVAGSNARAPRCTGHKSDGSGRRCTQPVFGGTLGGGTVCVKHGVNQAVRAAVKRRIAGARYGSEVAALAKELGDEIGPDPSSIDVLVASVRQAWVRAAVFDLYVSEQVRPWGPDHLGDNRMTAAEEGLRYWSTEAARRAKLAVDAGVETKRIEREERAVDDLVTAMSGFADSLGQALELAMTAAGIDVAVVRQAMTAARPAAFRRALGEGEALSVEAHEVPRESAKQARTESDELPT
jgi:hypothetical protein